MELFAMGASVVADTFVPLGIGTILFLGWFIAASLFRIWPSGRVLALFLAPTLLILVYFISDVREDFNIVFAFDALFVLVLLADFFSLAIGVRFTASRHTKQIASSSKSHTVTLEIGNRSRFGKNVEIIEDGHQGLFGDETHSFPQRFIPSNTSEKLDYRFTPLSRGAFVLESVYLVIGSYLGFWKKSLVIPCQTKIDVYPDLQQIGEYEMLARRQRLHQLGVRRVRRIGTDDDFERLRDYTLDDHYKFIDWKATARRDKLTVKDFQISRNQRIIFMIDAGRMMTNRAEGISLLDHSLNAMLMLGYIALKQGDEVGLICFADHVLRSIPARAGMSQMNHLVHGCFDVSPQPVESRYDLAFNELNSRSRKRSLVVLVTNVLDQRNSERIELHLSKLAGRHLPLGVFLRDKSMFNPVEEYLRPTNSAAAGESVQPQLLTQEDYHSLFRAGAAAEILNWRRLVMKRLSAQGALTLDLVPEQMTAPLINKYLEVKAMHLL
ncbi:MAG: DUF58 domain-containing protein [Planctomycetia bacterium]|nr:DUF58 domain-containing protein [Planctomycetia bacterium]